MVNIFVGNLSYQTNQDELHAAFAQYGAVERVNIVTDRDTGPASRLRFCGNDGAAGRGNGYLSVERGGTQWPGDERERSPSEAGGGGGGYGGGGGGFNRGGGGGGGRGRGGPRR